jgi:hypothetical protein
MNKKTIRRPSIDLQRVRPESPGILHGQERHLEMSIPYFKETGAFHGQSFDIREKMRGRNSFLLPILAKVFDRRKTRRR